MSNEIPEDPYRIIARERSHDEAKDLTVNRPYRLVLFRV
jgi:hypothetical protein